MDTIAYLWANMPGGGWGQFGAIVLAIYAAYWMRVNNVGIFTILVVQTTLMVLLPWHERAMAGIHSMTLETGPRYDWKTTQADQDHLEAYIKMAKIAVDFKLRHGALGDRLNGQFVEYHRAARSMVPSDHPLSGELFDVLHHIDYSDEA